MDHLFGHKICWNRLSLFDHDLFTQITSGPLEQDIINQKERVDYNDFWIRVKITMVSAHDKSHSIGVEHLSLSLSLCVRLCEVTLLVEE